MSRNFKRNLSSTYYDAGSFSSLASQTTLTDTQQKKSTQEEEAAAASEQDLATEANTEANSASTASVIEPPLPFQPSIWRVPTVNTRSGHSPDLERGMSTKSHYFLEDAPTRNTTIYNTELTRDNSIATAISMRRADIMVSRDNPQHLHQHRLSGVINTTTDEEVVTSTSNEPNHNPHQSFHHVVPERDELLYEKKKSVIILLGRLLLKCGCPCHRVVSSILNLLLYIF